MSTPTNNFTMVAGETMTLNVTSIYETTGALVDFTGATITWVMKQGSTTILTKTVGVGITVTGLGTFDIALATGNTTGLSGEYQHECRATLADGTVTTLFRGTATLEPTIIP